MPTLRKTLIVFLLVAFVSTATAASRPASATAPLASDPVARAVDWLHDRQLPGGGFGVNGNESAAMTADVVYALALAGEDPGGAGWTKNGQLALDALARLAPAYVGSDAGQAGKVARAVAAAGRDPSTFVEQKDLIAVIEAAYNPATGRYHPDFLFRHTVAIEALQRANLPVPPAAYAALRRAQLADGGWFWTFEATKSDVDTTGRVLQVLGRAPEGTCDTAFVRGANYLARAQTASAAWAVEAPPTTSLPNANSTGLAVGGLRSIGRSPDAQPYVKGGKSALQALLAFQEPGGAFVYIAEPGKEEVRLTATADALMGLLQDQGDPATAGCRPVYLPLLLVR